MYSTPFTPIKQRLSCNLYQNCDNFVCLCNFATAYHTPQNKVEPLNYFENRVICALFIWYLNFGLIKKQFWNMIDQDKCEIQQCYWSLENNVGVTYSNFIMTFFSKTIASWLVLIAKVVSMCVNIYRLIERTTSPIVL